MNNKNGKTVLLWAVDPFSSEWKCQKGAAHAIQGLAEKRGVEIQPVYVATNPLSNLPQGFSVEVFEGVREKGQDRLNEMLEGIPLKDISPLKIIQIQNNSVNEQVTSLLAYAKERGADTIVTGTRARTGVPRWFFGSFAESLSLRSKIPLLVVNPSWKGRNQQFFKDILFPTDFSEASHSAFREVIRFAKDTGAKVRIFHKYFHVPAPVWNSPLESRISYKEIYNDGLVEANRMVQEWESEAREQGVEVTSKVDVAPGDSAADAIVKESKLKPCLIAMAAESGQLEISFLGSVTRKVIRMAPCPVWVLHAGNEKAVPVDSPDSKLEAYRDANDFKFPKAL